MFGLDLRRSQWYACMGGQTESMSAMASDMTRSGVNESTSTPASERNRRFAACSSSCARLRSRSRRSHSSCSRRNSSLSVSISLPSASR